MAAVAGARMEEREAAAGTYFAQASTTFPEGHYRLQRSLVAAATVFELRGRRRAVSGTAGDWSRAAEMTAVSSDMLIPLHLLLYKKKKKDGSMDASESAKSGSRPLPR